MHMTLRSHWRDLALFVLVALASTVIQTASAGAQTPTCRGQRATIVVTNEPRYGPWYGTGGDDVIVGTSGSDNIYGLGGNDLICGGGGDDYINAGPGRDRVFGGNGNDYIDGSTGKDRLWGGSGDDMIAGTSGNDRLRGGSGNDVIVGGVGRDNIDAGSGNDRCDKNRRAERTADCEDVAQLSYKKVTVSASVAGGYVDLPGSIAQSHSTTFDLPTAAHELRSDRPFTIWTPRTNSSISVQQLLFDGFASGGSEHWATAPSQVSIEMYLALY